MIALGSELFHEAGEHLERRAGLGDVLADHEDGRVAPELFAECLVHRLANRQLARAGNRVSGIESSVTSLGSG